MEKPPPPPPSSSAAAPAPSSLLPYAVTAISVAVLVAVAALLFAQPRRARMAIDEVIVLDGAATQTLAATNNHRESSTAIDNPQRPEEPPAPEKEPAPGDVLEALLTDEGSSGDGSVKIGGITVYVSGGRRGERVRFRILDVKTSRKGNRYAKAELVGAATDGVPQEGTAP